MTQTKLWFTLGFCKEKLTLNFFGTVSDATRSVEKMTEKAQCT